MATLNYSNVHPKQMSQLLSSIASSPSIPPVLESDDMTHVMPSSVNSRGILLGTSSYSLKVLQMGFSTGGHACMGASPNDLCGRSPGIGAEIARKEATSPLLVVCPTDSMVKISRQHLSVELTNQGFGILLSSTGGLDLPGSSLDLRVPHQDHMETYIPEVYLNFTLVLI